MQDNYGEKKDALCIYILLKSLAILTNVEILNSREREIQHLTRRL